MGTNLSAIQIRNYLKASPGQFMESLRGYFEKKGLTYATEEDALYSYRLAFSCESDWVTICCPEYEGDQKMMQEDAQGMAKALRTYSVAANVFDSDMIQLHLYGAKDEQNDIIFAGRMPWGESEDAGFPVPKGTQEQWEPLLSAGSTWEQLTQTLNSSYTYAEDALPDIAPLLGMDPENIATDYNHWDRAGSTAGVIDIYLKKAQPPGKKAVSLNSAFRQIFGEALEPLGFVKLKGKQPYFVRLIGDEIIHVIALINDTPKHPNWKNFNIIGGVATVYRQKIDLTWSPQDNGNWLKYNCDYYSKLNPNKHGDEVWESLYRFSYKKEDEKAMFSEIRRSLNATLQFMIPVLDKVADIETCMEHFHKFGPYLHIYEDYGEMCNFGKHDHYSEGLLLVKENEQYSPTERMEKLLKTESDIETLSHNFKNETCKSNCNNNPCSQELLLVRPQSQGGFEERIESLKSLVQEVNIRVGVNNCCKNIEIGRIYLRIIHDILFGVPERYERASKELERRKIVNTEALRSYGLSI